jgi:replicative DNA helicase
MQAVEELPLSLDLTTLRLLKYRDRHDKLARSVPMRALDVRTQIVLKDFGRYFRDFPESQKVDHDAFNMVFQMEHPELKDEDLAVYKQLFKLISSEDVAPDIEAGMMKRLGGAAAAYDLASLIEKYNAGEEVDLRQGVEALMDQYDQQTKRVVKDPQVRDPIEQLLKDEENDVGLHWRLSCLNRHIKPVVAGDFIVVAARPDKGKTTFGASELTFMASQVDTIWPGEERSILWFNNEGPGKRIVTRCFQAALGATMEELVAKSNAGTIRDEYRAALGGRGGSLRIFDVHGMWNHEIEDLINKYKPALCLWDMIDNVRFGDAVANNGQRTDQLLEAMYGWVRMMGVKHDCAMMAMSQISADGDGLQFPTLPMLKDSKTGKQGAADVIITLGTVNDPILGHARYIGTTKNKKVRTGVPGSPMAQVRFDGDRGRYVED